MCITFRDCLHKEIFGNLIKVLFFKNKSDLTLRTFSFRKVTIINILQLDVPSWVLKFSLKIENKENIRSSTQLQRLFECYYSYTKNSCSSMFKIYIEMGPNLLPLLRVHAKSLQLCQTTEPQDCVMNLWTIAHQAPLSMGFSWQEYWSGFPWPSAGNLHNPGIKPCSLMSPALAGRFFTGEPLRKPLLLKLFNSRHQGYICPRLLTGAS